MIETTASDLLARMFETGHEIGCAFIDWFGLIR